MLGDPRTNQNPAFLALGIVFYRWHNLQAAKIQEVHPDWDDEDIFQAARRRVIATLQVSNRPRITQFFKELFRLSLTDLKEVQETNHIWNRKAVTQIFSV